MNGADSVSRGLSIGVGLVSAVGHLSAASRGGRLLILIYHRVRPLRDPLFPGEVDRIAFDWQMRLLRRYCVPMRLSDAVSRLRDGALPSRAVAVTFDDGYADNAEVALPILRSHGVPATFFVTAGMLDGGLMWNDAIIEALRMARSGEVDLTSLRLGTVTVGCMRSRGDVAGSLINAIKHLPADERARSVEVIRCAMAADMPRSLMMTAQQVRSLAAAGMEIGAHTMTHPILKNLPETEVVREIDEGRRSLEHIVGSKVRSFAYPNGRPGLDYGEREVAIVRQLGFEFAACTQWGAATAQSDCFQLPRFTPWDQTPERWFGRLLWAFGKRA